MATIQIKHVPDDVHRMLSVRAAAAGKSLQQYMLDSVYMQSAVTSAEELLDRKQAEVLAHGETHVDPAAIVEVIRADQDSG